jgi:hypothetical protein
VDAGFFLLPFQRDGSASCPYSPEIEDDVYFFSVQVSHAGYRTEDVSNMYMTGATGPCGQTPGTPQVVDIKLTPVGS